MKKIIASAVGLMLVGGVAATSAFAVESQFGGYWRARSFFQDNYTQPDSAYNRTDQRTRLYYTAKFNDNFKFVNRFEFNSNWGDSVGGDIGADGNIFVVKHSYADFTLGMVNTKVGMMGGVIGRHFIFDNDFSGAMVTADFGAVTVPVVYVSGAQQDVNPESAALLSDGTIKVTDALTTDTHVLSIMPTFKVGDNVSLTPNATWLTTTSSDTDLFWLGLDVDAKFDAVSAWGTLIYEGGQTGDGVAPSVDKSAWLVAAGADVNIIHGQAFYASGDDGKDATETNNFTAVSPSYYWSEIMGFGVFDNAAPTNSPGDYITNVWAANVGVTVKPMDKLTFDFDVWYAQKAEEILAYNGKMEDELGLEFDAKLTYALMDNLNAELVYAYLVAGDATGPEDVMEGGVRLSLSF